MFPGGTKKNEKSGRRSRALEQRQQVAARRTGRTSSSSSSHVQPPPRPEDAPSSNAALRRRAAADLPPPPHDEEEEEESSSRAFAVRPHRNRSSGDDASDNDDDDAEEDANDSDDNENTPLDTLLRQLRQFCRDGGGDRNNNNKESSSGPTAAANAISVGIARRVLEAAGGNVTLAGQLYWDNFFATQILLQQGNNPPPLDAPSAAAEAAEAPPPDPEEEERRVRRRLESDFERLLPPPQQPAQAAVAALPPQADAVESRLDRRRRRRILRRQEADGGALGNIVRANRNRRTNNNNNGGDGGILLAGEPNNNNQAAVAAAPPRQQLEENHQALFVAARAVLGGGEDAADGSVSVSDDEAGVVGVLRMVRDSGRNSSITNNRGRRRPSSGLDEDNPGYVRARGMISAQLSNEEDAAAAAAAAVPGEQRRKRSRQAVKGNQGGGGGGDDSGESDSDDSNHDGSDEDDAYLSENDWLLAPPSVSTVPANSRTSQPRAQLRARVPIDILWGGLLAATPVDTTEKAPKKKKQKTKEEDEEMSDEEKIKEEDEDANSDNGDEAGSAARSRAGKQGIPSTWWHASFSPHSTVMGLALKDPKPDDVADNSWRLHQLNNAGAAGASPRRNSTLPMPYHCRAITAVLSIVTAMLYTGASVQSNQVTCSSSRTPFLELSEEDRKREFESRLIDALSSLIFIAARSSMGRKKKAVDKILAKKNRRKKRRRKKKDELGQDEVDEPDATQMHLKRKLKLFPVTWWRENATGEPYTPQEQWQKAEEDSSTEPPIQLNTSYSNIGDVRAYVLSNMRSFTAPGGVALLLETIVGIHGPGALTRMLRKSSATNDSAKKDSKDTMADCPSKNPFLVHCTCEERQKERLQDASLLPAARRKLMNAVDTTPPGHDCVSVELMSLLLTGTVHSSLKGWTTGPLGFGILSQTKGEVGDDLSRPEMPVWVLKGSTCYSVLLLDHTNHGENLNETAPVAESNSKDPKNAKSKAAEKKSLSPAKPKAAPCLKMSLCTSTSRSRDLFEGRTFAKDDRPGLVANLTHWNCWFGVRNLSGLRLITNRPKWSPPSPSEVLASYRNVPEAKHSHSLTCRRKSVAEQLQERRNSVSNVVSADEREAPGSGESTADACRAEAVRFHPDDANFYPKQYRRWRFDVGAKEGAENDPNSKPRGAHWTPYFALDQEEQMLVEAKFGPQINRILWNRWPSATIDKFTPEDKSEPLPIV